MIDASDSHRTYGNIIESLKTGEKIAGDVGKALSVAETCFELREEIDGDEGNRLEDKKQGWSGAQSPDSLHNDLESRKHQKQDNLNLIYHTKSGFTDIQKYVATNGDLPDGSSLRRLSPTLFGSGANPFLGPVVCATVVAIDGYLTRETVRSESCRIIQAIEG